VLIFSVYCKVVLDRQRKKNCEINRRVPIEYSHVGSSILNFLLLCLRLCSLRFLSIIHVCTFHVCPDMIECEPHRFKTWKEEKILLCEYNFRS